MFGKPYEDLKRDLLMFLDSAENDKELYKRKYSKAYMLGMIEAYKHALRFLNIHQGFYELQQKHLSTLKGMGADDSLIDNQSG